jgi:hypothetical protein
MTRSPDRPDLLFIIGTGRCGSTVVQELLARHPDIGFVSNVDAWLAPLDLKGRWNGPLYRRLPLQLTRRDRVGRGLVQRRLHFGPSEAYRLLDRQVSHIISTPFRDLTEDDLTPWLAARLRRFYLERAAAQLTPVFLHKFTGWPRARFLHAVFPEARFLHVLRDGRAVAASLMQRPWWRGQLGPWGWRFGPLPPPYSEEWEANGQSLVALAGLEWKILIDAAEQARAALPPDRWMDLRYEDFVRDPRGSIRSILSWMDVPPAGDVDAALATAYSLERTTAYRRHLAPGQVAMLDDLLGDHLRRYGYATPTPPG